ncbi:MAG: DNA/RNA nuclease SfsA [Bacillota bacterium]|jgi:sugar fermentation stimulation protein A|nr:DNA/RNA nuclease SfsA [Candidatus Fermentithermobacillaceae bacterium]
MVADPFRVLLGDLLEGIVVDRPNRFVAIVMLDGKEVRCHVADSGRLKELIYPGNRVMVRSVGDGREKTGQGLPSRKTSFDLVLASAGGPLTGYGSGGPEHDRTTWVSVDTRYPTRLFGQALRARGVPEFAEYGVVRPEYSLYTHERNGVRRKTRVPEESEHAGERLLTTGIPDKGLGEKTKVRKQPRSRFDFYLEGSGVAPALVEVKSVTLCVNGKGLFPDAPTERGARHLRELAEAVSIGYRAYAVFIAQREDILTVSPNRNTDPKFAEALAEAARRGVRLLAYRCSVSPREIVFDPALLPVVV